MKPQTADKLATAGFWLVAVMILALLFLLVGYILFKGLPHLSLNFLTSPPRATMAGGGIGPELINSFTLLMLTIVLLVPIGTGAGIYMAEYAKSGPFTSMIRLSLETLASLPSIVVGLFGLLIFVTMTGWGYSLLSGALILVILNLPVMVRITEDAVRTVPKELKEASLALGGSHWQTIWRVLVPSAFQGIATGVIIASGRVFGEAAALLYTAGQSSPNLDISNFDPTSPRSPLNLLRPAETLAVHIWKVNAEGLIPDYRAVADGSAAVLILVVIAFNIFARSSVAFIHRKLTGY